MSSARVRGADLRGAKLVRANLTGLKAGASLGDQPNNFAGADLSAADLSGADLKKADLSGANLTGAQVAGARLDKVNWKGATCPDGTKLGDDRKATCEGHLGRTALNP
jgi:uncharacterized protein YjbI with pentapeptide repeats